MPKVKISYFCRLYSYIQKLGKHFFLPMEVFCFVKFVRSKWQQKKNYCDTTYEQRKRLCETEIEKKEKVKTKYCSYF